MPRLSLIPGLLLLTLALPTSAADDDAAPHTH